MSQHTVPLIKHTTQQVTHCRSTAELITVKQMFDWTLPSANFTLNLLANLTGNGVQLYNYKVKLGCLLKLVLSRGIVRKGGGRGGASLSKAWLPVPEKIIPPFASETNPLFDEKNQLPIFLNIKIVLKTYPFVFLINPFDKEKIMSQILTFLKHCLCLNFLAIQVPSFSANIFFLARNF